MIKYTILRKKSKLIISLIAFSLILGTQVVLAKGKTTNFPELKNTQEFSNDWIMNKLNSIRVDNKSDFYQRKPLSGTNKSSNIQKAVAFQHTNQDPDEKLNSQQPTEESNQININENAFNETKTENNSSENKILDPNAEYQNVKSGVTELRSTVGRSQIIQFAQPIKRLSITDPSLADLILLSPTQMIMNGKAAGVTSLIIWDEQDQPAFFDLYVLNDTSKLLDAFKQVAPDEHVNIKVTDDGNVILSGTLSSTIVRDQLEKICQAYGYTLVDVAESPVPQVVLELRIAEISRALTRNFNLLSNIGAWPGNNIWPYNISGSTTPPIVPMPNPTVWDGNMFGWNGNSTNGFTAAIYRPHDNLAFVFNTAQAKGLLSILAEPKIVSTHGREASFDSIQSVPVPTGVDQNGNLAFEYKDVGVSLKFTPWISEKSQRVELKIAPEVSEIDPTVTLTQPNGIKVFGFRKRKTSTIVELENGETLMIAGLIRRGAQQSVITPGIFDSLPIIGKLFNSSNFVKDESELVIMVSPKIVKPGVYGEVLGTSE